MEILEFCAQKLRSTDVEKFELFWEKSTSLGIEINDGKLDHLSRATDQGLAIRVLKNQKLGFSYTIDLSHEAVEQAVRTALEITELMPADPLNDLSSFSTSPYPEIEAYDSKALLEISLDRKIEIARELEVKTKAHDRRIQRVRKSGFDESAYEIAIMDSNAETIRHRATVFASYITCVAEGPNGQAQMGSDSQYTHYLDALNPDFIAETAAKNAVSLLGAGTAPTMRCPAVFKNSIVAQLLGFLSASFSAENIDKNSSLLIGKKGEKVFSDRINIFDDGMLPDGIGSSPFDGEGSPSRKTTLVEGGMVTNYLYDNYYARKHKVTTTANAQRGLKSPPSIGTTNLYLQKGSKSLDKIFSGIKKGIFITEVMGLHTANPVTGDFSVGASGILIENGALTTPVKGFAIAGNLVDLLSRVSDVGSDLRFWGSIGAPSLLVSELNISGS